MLSGCGSPAVCITEPPQPPVVVEIRDRVTGAPAARGVTGESQHQSKVRTELAALGDLRLVGRRWRDGLHGTHTIRVRKPGFGTETVSVDVDRHECGVQTSTVRITIAPDPRAMPEYPVSFTEGPEIGALPASARVRLYGDTLEIGGFAPAGRQELRVVASRTDIRLHVQVEPSDIPPLGTRQFAVRFTLPPGPTDLIVTNGYGHPTILFIGQVRPTMDG